MSIGWWVVGGLGRIDVEGCRRRLGRLLRMCRRRRRGRIQEAMRGGGRKGVGLWGCRWGLEGGVVFVGLVL